MKKAVIALLFLYTAFASAATSSATATLTDPDGQSWNIGTYIGKLVSPKGPPTIGGVPVPDAQQNVHGSLSATGAFTVTLADTSTIDQAGATYTFTFQPNASVVPSVITGIAVIGATPNLSAVLSAAILAPRFPAGPNAFGYLDQEIAPSPAIGATYFNTGTTTPGLRQYSLSGWTGGGVNSGNAAVPVIASGLIGQYLFQPATPYSDTSGNGNDCVPAAGANAPTPTPQGLLFSFNTSTPQWCTMPTGLNTGKTFMAYLCQTPQSASVSAEGNGYPNQVVLGSNSTSGLLLHLFANAVNEPGPWYPGMGQNVFGGGQGPWNDTTSTDVTGGCQVITWEVGTSPTPDRIFIGQNEVTYGFQGISGPLLGFGQLQLGSNQAGGLTDTGFWGTVRNLFVWDRDLATAEVTYMAGISQQLASSNGIIYPPQKSQSVTSQLSCIGDSITFGQGVTNSYCSAALFVPTETPITVNNYGVQGRFATAMNTRVELEQFPQFASNALHNTASIFGGTNDFALDGISVTQVYAANVSMSKRLQLNGYKTVLIPMLSRGGAGLDADKNALDTLMNMNWPSVADSYIAPTDPLLWADGANANLTYFQDTTHPTQLGQNIIAGYLVNSYNKLYGSTSQTPNMVATTPYTLQAADSFVRVTASSALTLPNCLGYAGSWHVNVQPAATVTIANATAAQTINGVDHSTSPLALSAGSNTGFQVSFGPSATGGCTWITTP